MAMICMLGFSATQAVLPFIVKYVFDNIFARKDEQALMFLPFAIVEEGTHEELLARKSEYSRLYTLQLLEDEGASHGRTVH